MNTKNIQNINTGVNTGKAQLDIYIRPLDIFFSVPNDNKGIKKAASLIGVAPVTRESGRYKGKRTGASENRAILPCNVTLFLKPLTLDWWSQGSQKK